MLPVCDPVPVFEEVESAVPVLLGVFGTEGERDGVRTITLVVAVAVRVMLPLAVLLAAALIVDEGSLEALTVVVIAADNEALAEGARVLVLVAEAERAADDVLVKDGEGVDDCDADTLPDADAVKL